MVTEILLSVLRDADSFRSNTVTYLMEDEFGSRTLEVPQMTEPVAVQRGINDWLADPVGGVMRRRQSEADKHIRAMRNQFGLPNARMTQRFDQIREDWDLPRNRPAESPAGSPCGTARGGCTKSTCEGPCGRS